MDVRKARAEAKSWSLRPRRWGCLVRRESLGRRAHFCQGDSRTPSFLARRWKPSTVKTNSSYLQRTLIPFFGDMPMATIQRTDVARWRDSLAARRHIQPRSAGALDTDAGSRGLWLSPAPPTLVAA
jgi:hypothetical protein